MPIFHSPLRSSRRSRCHTIVLVLLCYVWAVMLPAGVMPVQTANGNIAITLCPGTVPIASNGQSSPQLTQAQQRFDQWFLEHNDDSTSDEEPNMTLCQWSVMASSTATLPDNPMALLWLSLYGADYVEIILPTALPKRLATQHSARGPPAFLLS